MKNLVLILFLICLTSCGLKKVKHFVHEEKATRIHSTSSPIFASYVQNFEAHAKSSLNDSTFSVGDIPINFGDTGEETFDGVCKIYSDDKKEIIIDKQWWEATDKTQKEVLIFHELGHCRLGRDHHEEIISNNLQNVKVSIMSSEVPNTISYSNFKESYIKELFTYNKDSMMKALGIVVEEKAADNS